MTSVSLDTGSYRDIHAICYPSSILTLQTNHNHFKVTRFSLTTIHHNSPFPPLPSGVWG